MNIIILLQNYFEFKKKTDSLIFTEKLKIKEKLVVNDLLKEDEKSLRNFIYIFIVMSSISSKKDTYIDRISETEERYMDKYLSIIEKYITVEYPSNNEPEPVNRNITKRLTLRKSTTINSFSLENNLAFINSNKNTNLLKQEISNYENVKANLQRTIEELKLENDELRNKNCILNEKIELVTTKQNELIKELEIAKSSQVNRDDIFNDLLLINSLKTTIAQKELEVEDVKKDYQQNVKNYLDKIAKNKKKREQVSSALGEKTSECLELKTENDKLKAKLKESQTLKEKVTDYESLRVQISVQKNQINDMKIEKASLETHISNLSNEISQEKEQSRRNVYLKEFAENKVIDLQSEINSLKETIKNREKMNNPLIKKKSTFNMQSQEFLKIEQNQQNLYELENEYLIDEMQKEFEEKTENFLKEIEDLKNKILPLEQEKSKLEEENQTMKEKLEYLESNILQIRNENEKILFEKEKIEVSVKKIELEYKMQIFNVEKEKETLEMKHSHNLMKLEEISKLKEFLNNELEKCREQLNNSNTNLERATREKFELLKELERYKSDGNMKKIELEKESKIDFYHF
jgi:exonuclease SbcC